MGFGSNSELIDSRSADVVLQVDGCEFPCHRATLCASSRFFCAMFCGSFLQGISRKAMEHLLDFVYEGKLDVDEENVESVFQAADQLEVSELSAACVRFLEKRVGPGNCLGLLDFGRSYSLRPLQDQCQNLLDHNFEEVSQHEEFLSSPAARVLELLTCERLRVTEEVLVEAALRWIHHRPVDRKHHLKELLEQMRLPRPGVLHEHTGNR